MTFVQKNKITLGRLVYWATGASVLLLDDLYISYTSLKNVQNNILTFVQMQLFEHLNTSYAQ